MKKMKNKKSTSIALSEDIKKALDIIIESYDGNLPIKNRSELIEYVTKVLVFQILNDEETIIDEVDEVKESLLENGFTKNSYFSGRGSDSEEMVMSVRGLAEKMAIKIYGKKLEKLNDEGKQMIEALVISLLRKKLMWESDEKYKSEIEREMRMLLAVELYEKNINYTTRAEKENIEEVMEIIF